MGATFRSLGAGVPGSEALHGDPRGADQLIMSHGKMKAGLKTGDYTQRGHLGL